jgi:hypothetical protein
MYFGPTLWKLTNLVIVDNMFKMYWYSNLARQVPEIHEILRRLWHEYLRIVGIIFFLLGSSDPEWLIA